MNGSRSETDYSYERHEDEGRVRAAVDPFPSSTNARLARSAIQARARRAQHFNASLFSDPAWDILLELFLAECENRRVPISAVGVAHGIPMTTMLRWLSALETEGLVSRKNDPFHRRRMHVNLTEAGVRSMAEYFERKELHETHAEVNGGFLRSGAIDRLVM